MQSIVKYALCRRAVQAVIAVSWALCAIADDRLDIERTASIFHSYEFVPVDDTPPPDGFEPFYISHYGRHGSRRLAGTCVADTCAVLEDAAKKGRLTDEGMSLRSAVRRIADASVGMEGQLTERGAEEHRRIARRMAARFPKVFEGKRRVRCQSTEVHRVLISQANFTMALKDAAPGMDFSFVTGPKYTTLLKHHFRKRKGANGEGVRRAKEKFDKAGIKTDGFVSRMFTTPEAANIQMAFYHNKDGETLVKILYNEREILVRGLELAVGPYYRWRDLRAHILAAVNLWGKER